MKFIPLIFLAILANTCNSTRFPEKMPDDFKIEYHLDGGMINTSRTITLQKGKCSDHGRDEGVPYEYEWENKDIPALEVLYNDLKMLNAFTLKSKNAGHVDDRGGESIQFTMNGKDYEVSDSQSNFITKKDAPAFNKAIELILAYTSSHRVMKAYSSDDFPEKMPDDFTIEYQYAGGEDGRTLFLTKVNCSDQGVFNKTGFEYSWKNTSLPEFENLYTELRKLNAFGLQTEEYANEGDKVEESIQYTINGKTYAVSNRGNRFITKQDLPAFNESVKLIADYALVHSRTSTNSTSAFPEKMPADFKIEYEWAAGMTGDNQTIVLQLGDCRDEGNKINEDAHSFRWVNKDKPGFENLYNELNKLNAFIIKYTEKEKVYDRGGESLRFTIDGKVYMVSNSGKCFIDQADQAAFKKAVGLVLTYANKNH